MMNLHIVDVGDTITLNHNLKIQLLWVEGYYCIETTFERKKDKCILHSSVIDLNSSIPQLADRKQCEFIIGERT
ncbi:MAG: hypothetical protein ACWGQW_00940 [bacterium]